MRAYTAAAIPYVLDFAEVSAAKILGVFPYT
jgi:hypothetical protein